MTPTKMLVLDTETGGLDPQRHSILQVGAVVWELDKPLTDTAVFDRKIIETPCNADPEALAVNGIDIAKHARIAFTPGEALHDLRRFINDHFEERVVLCGHNIGFDVGFLQRLFRLGFAEDYEQVFSHRTMDTANIGRFLILAGKVPFQEPKSESLFEHFGCKPVVVHDALYDALATAQLLNKMLELIRA